MHEHWVRRYLVAVRRKGNEASMLVVIACFSYILCCVLYARIIVGCEQLQCKEIIYVENMKQARYM